MNDDVTAARLHDGGFAAMIRHDCHGGRHLRAARSCRGAAQAVIHGARALLGNLARGGILRL
jgi:hypothetical protein